MNKKENMSMKNSNIKWIGRIPQGWEIKRFKNYFTNIGGGNYGYDIQENSKIKLPCFSISDFKNGNLDNENKNLIKTNRAYDKENILKKGIILVEKSGGGEKTPVGRMVIVKEDIKAYYTNFVQGIKINNKMNENFILYILKTTYNLRLHMKYVKQNTGLQNFKFNNFANDLLIPVPKLEVQNKIVNFIDYNLITLSKKIKKYNKKIELLKEYKEALIYETITKGLDKNVEMKDSGIDWVGKIPNTWQTERVKDILILRKGKNAGTYSGSYVSEKENQGVYPVYSGQTENKGIMGLINTYEYDYSEGVLFTTTVGAKAMSVNKIKNKFSMSQNCGLLIPKRDINIDYYFYLISMAFVFSRNAIPSHMQPSLRKEDLNHIYIPKINIKEQEKIACFLSEKIDKIENEMSLILKKVELIKELKESIIYECVTGKLNIEVDGEKYQKIIESI